MKNIWVPLSGQIAQQRKVETIANNVANANTAGFKRDQVVFKEHLTALTKGVEDIDIPRKEFSPEDFYHTQGGENAAVAVAGTYTIHEQGQLVPTNNPFDVAVNGPGFIEVLTPQGVRFTRQGNLALSSEGELVTSQGHKVLMPVEIAPAEIRGPAGQSIPRPEERVVKIPQNQPITVSLEGEIFTRQGGSIGKISVVEFADQHALQKEGGSLFINPDESNATRVGLKTKLQQGFMEGSNVNAVEEMSELVKAHRHFESIQKAINAYDSMTGRAVNDIAKF